MSAWRWWHCPSGTASAWCGAGEGVLLLLRRLVLLLLKNCLLTMYYSAGCVFWMMPCIGSM
jgi:hypothetical protein